MRKLNLTAWMKAGRYLPKEFRDFHAQKDLFKTIHEIYALDASQAKAVEQLSWIGAHIYVIDFFLWFMAKRGYTLQRSKAKLEFLDMSESIENSKKIRDDASAKAMGLTNKD